MKKIILGFTGEIGSGKGTVTKYVQEKYGASYYRFSDVIRKALNLLYLDESRDNMQNLSTILRKNFGEDLFSKVIFENVKRDKNDLVVIDGMRRLADFRYLDTLPEFVFIYIETDNQVRYERMVKRNENPGDAEKTFEQFVQDQKDEADAQIKDLKVKAQYTIENNGTVEELHQEVDKLIGLIQNK